MSGNYDGLLSRYTRGVRLNVKAKPGAAHARAPKIVPLADGGRAVEITVVSPPEDGKANKALLGALAGYLGVRKAALAIKAGASGRFKIVEIEGDPEGLFQAAACWLAILEKRKV